MIIKRNFEQEKPEEYQVCLILPQFVKATWEDDRFLSDGGRISHLGVKYWIPIREITELFEEKTPC